MSKVKFCHSLLSECADDRERGGRNTEHDGVYASVHI